MKGGQDLCPHPMHAYFNVVQSSTHAHIHGPHRYGLSRVWVHFNKHPGPEILIPSYTLHTPLQPSPICVDLKMPSVTRHFLLFFFKEMHSWKN